MLDDEDLRRRLGRLSAAGRVLFALACAERLLPHYVAFFNEVGWGDPAGLAGALDYAWGRALHGAAEGSLHELQRRVEGAIPDTEDFSVFSVSGALDSAAAVAGVLDLFEDAGVDATMEVATLARDNADVRVRERAEAERLTAVNEAWIATHPVLQRELQLQEAALRLAEAWESGEVSADVVWERLGGRPGAEDRGC